MQNPNLDSYLRHVANIIFDADMLDGYKIEKIEQLLKESYEDGYDQAAQDITMKLQSCIPSSATNVPDARVQGAWRDAANVALNHLGKLSR